jgi:UDP-MurNAc hydroxylase
LQRHNQSLRPPGIFPDAEQATAWLAEHLPAQRWACFRPGDWLDLTYFDIEPDETSARFSYTEGLDDYLDAYASDRKPALDSLRERYFEPDHFLVDHFVEHFSGLGLLSRWFLTRIGMTMRFDVLGPHGGTWDVVMGEHGLEIDLTAATSRPEYTLRVEGRWLLPVLTGEMAWEDLFLSLRFTAERDPDVYNDYLFGLLKHANQPALRAVEEYENLHERPGEQIIVESEGAAYSIERMCPHAGEDLAEGAIVEAGVIRCLGHNFEFDLETGRCLNARCRPLTVQRVAPVSH